MLQAAGPGPQEPPEPRGRATIADGVEKIAGIAAREVPGINALGGGFTRTMGAVRGRVPGGHASAGRGVKVEVGEKQTAIDLQVVVKYGVTITEVAVEVREKSISAVERMAGLEVVEVNIAVNDVHLPDDGAPESSDNRGGAGGVLDGRLPGDRLVVTYCGAYNTASGVAVSLEPGGGGAVRHGYAVSAVAGAGGHGSRVCGSNGVGAPSWHLAPCPVAAVRV